MSKLALLGGDPVIRSLAGMSFQVSLVRRMLEKRKQGSTSLGTDFAAYVGAEYALPVSSGTAALFAAVVAAGVGPGDEVLVVSFTWLATVSAVLLANGVPVFVDIDEKTFTMDPEDVKRKITNRTKAILAVDIYGHPAPLFELKEIARDNDLVLIEDAAQATGARIGDDVVGGIADITAFSFAGKPLMSTSGGILTTNSREFFERAALVGQHPAYLSRLITLPELRDYVSTGYGANHRPDWHAVETAHENLSKMDAISDARIANARHLTAGLAGLEGITPPHTRDGVRHVYHMYTCLFDEECFGVSRDLFVEALRSEGLDVWRYIDGPNYVFDERGKGVNVGALHHRTIFRERNLYGKGCPFQCPHATPRENENESLPVTDRVTQREFNFTQAYLSPPNGVEKMDQCLDAIHKVVENIGELRDYSPAP